LTVEGLVIEPGVPVWWRRTGFLPPLATMSEEENRLRSEESEALFLGGLLALTDRWVDDPFVVMAAEHSLRQLAVAARVGVRVPPTIATNLPEAARSFAAATSGALIAKATSAGVGIAPYADVIDPRMFDLLPNCMTLLQHAQAASEDVRAVVVGEQVMTWVRARGATDPLDWRAADPGGTAFVRRHVEGIAALAVAVNNELGLKFSVQDWLRVDGSLVFLEVNPSGQWLFLPDAEDIVADALANLLLARWP
jgi:glutathione synthase/RimK-type ligase-like ATP-grasp enzyme